MNYQPKKKQEKEIFEQKIGIGFNEGEHSFTGFMTNFKTASYKDTEDNEQKTAMLCYFQDEEGEVHKLYYAFRPYFYVEFEKGMDREVHAYLDSKLSRVQEFELIQKIDLEEINHLSGKKKSYFKLSFHTIKDLNNAKSPLKQEVDRRKKKISSEDNYFSMIQQKGIIKGRSKYEDVSDMILGIREYDVTYHSRVCIDTGLRAGKWFNVKAIDQFIEHVELNTEKQSMPDLKILSYDIETSKDPLKFPDPDKDQVIMISLMYEGEAFLIINMGFCGNEVEEFSYSPKEEYACHVTVYNEESEKATLTRFASFMQSYRPTVVTTFNGDRFDYPFIKARFQANYLNFTSELGVSDQGSEYFGNYVSHLDCYHWVERDAYLPQGSHGLKAVTKAKLNYDPIEVDPEDMVEIAKNNTQRLAEYAVSDAVATFHLYMKHIHGFIFALSTIIPMFPDEVLRKGSGTLCESLLMVEAFNRNIIFPNKKMEQFEKYYQGKLLDTETYTGGRVQCLRTGVYRAEFPTQFNLDPTAFNDLIQNLDEIIKFSLEIEMPEQTPSDIANYSEVIQALENPLKKLRDVTHPSRHEAKPLIYHLDVAAMYPNIILTNRLQPVAIVNDRICSGCLFNTPESDCKRQLQWEWKGEVFPLNEGEYQDVKDKFRKKEHEEKEGTQQYEKKLKQEIKNYCQKVYKKVHVHESEIKTDTVCMRQNSFYVDTVRAFRDRRYQYKRKVKEQRALKDKAKQSQNFIQADEHNKLMALYESMQLAHKIILNSFYGYVMRKGARWYSMETAAMVTYIGSNIIKDSKDFIEARIGKPLELDTDGIWLLLPEGFPQNVKIKFKNGKTYTLSYPCFILNHLIYKKYMNTQYQTLRNEDTFDYEKTKEMTIFFEIDGPYKAMMIPAAKEKQKTTELDIQQHSTQLLKKRYCVFNFKNQISEFKGFEMKRRGQLRITKVFQEEIFPQYLKGNNLKECYAACAETASKYINIINKRGEGMNVDEILDYFQESRVLSKDIKDYGSSKGVAINSAKRLAQFLGPEVIKGKTGLTCYYVISELPANKPVTERAIPTQIFDAQPQTQREYLYRWTGNDKLLERDVEIKDILDWSYYFERLSTQIQKMVCIPAVLQNLSNPIEQIELPEWLKKKTYDMRHHKQAKMESYGLKFIKEKEEANIDIGKASIQRGQIEQRMPVQSQVVNEEKKKPTSSLKNPHSMMTNFSSFLTAQKRIWKERKHMTAQQSAGGNKSFDLTRQQDLKSILHIVPEPIPGTFNVWYHSNNKIQQMLVSIKHRYYRSGAGLKKAPHDEGQALEIVIEEETFLKNQDYYDCMMGTKFYETKMPLLTNLIIKKGNIWKIPRQMSVYNEEHIQEFFGEEYLPNIEDNFMPTVYLVRCKVRENRIIWATFNPRIKEYKFVFVDRAVGGNVDELINLARKAINKSDSSITINSFKTETEASKIINEILQKYQNSLKQPYLVLLHGQNIQRVKNYGIDMLEAQLPVLYLGSIEGASDHSKPGNGLDILDWKPRYIRRLIAESQKVTNSIVNFLRWSRYSHIPICNLSVEAMKSAVNSASQSESESCLLNYVTNIALTRLLHAGDHLTWWDEYSSELTTSYENEFYTGRVNNPQLIKSYAIEIDVNDFAINTIVNSDELMKEDREVALMMQERKSNVMGSSTETFYDTMEVRKAFDYVKKMIRIWVKDLEYFQSDEANLLLKNFHKWMVTHNNPLYDPLLTRMINDLMKKTFYRFLGRLNELGMTIVSGTFTKIIVATEKYHYEEAVTNITYIMEKCIEDNQKLFRYIKLTPNNFLYKVLLFKDQYNYVSIKSDNDEYCFSEEKFEIKHVLNPTVGKNLRLMLIVFVRQISLIKDALESEFQDRKMKLFLEYEKLLYERIIQYLEGEFLDGVVKTVARLKEEYELNLIRKRRQELLFGNQEATDDENHLHYTHRKNRAEDGQEDRPHRSQNRGGIRPGYGHEGDDDRYEEDEEEDDSFIDHSYMSEEEAEKQKVQRNEEKKIDMKWEGEHQLDLLVENLFSWLSLDERLKEPLYEIRKQSMQVLREEPSIEKWIIQPIYPVFELPCSSCYHINTQPGQCSICKSPLEAKESLEFAVWKMMQEQGRDTYCDRCKRIKVGFLKKCNCGGKWCYREFPLNWLKYTPRTEQEWGFVNEVFDFMGMERPEYQQEEQLNPESTQ